MYTVPMREETASAETSCVSRGAVVMLESVLHVREVMLIYRLSVEPRREIRACDRKRYYSVTVEKQRRGVRTRSLLRDFTDSFQEAEAFFYRLVLNAVLPENLSDVEKES